MRQPVKLLFILLEPLCNLPCRLRAEAPCACPSPSLKVQVVLKIGARESKVRPYMGRSWRYVFLYHAVQGSEPYYVQAYQVQA